MQFRTFLKTGVEVLQLGGQNWESNAWPIEHWRANQGRWRLFAPAIDDFLNADLAGKSFGTSIDCFVLLLEIADFKAWGEGLAFTGPEGFTRYKHKTREIWSVGRLDWTEIRSLTARRQLRAYELALLASIDNIARAKRRPKDFDAQAFASAVAGRLRLAKVSQLSRAAYVSCGKA